MLWSTDFFLPLPIAVFIRFNLLVLNIMKNWQIVVTKINEEKNYYSYIVCQIKKKAIRSFQQYNKNTLQICIPRAPSLQLIQRKAEKLVEHNPICSYRECISFWYLGTPWINYGVTIYKSRVSKWLFFSTLHFLLGIKDRKIIHGKGDGFSKVSK